MVEHATSMSDRTLDRRAVLYAGIGSEFVQYDTDAAAGALVRRTSVKVLANVQYAWQHASNQYVYVASSNRGLGGGSAASATKNHLSAFRIDLTSGALRP